MRRALGTTPPTHAPASTAGFQAMEGSTSSTPGVGRAYTMVEPNRAICSAHTHGGRTRAAQEQVTVTPERCRRARATRAAHPHPPAHPSTRTSGAVGMMPAQ